MVEDAAKPVIEAEEEAVSPKPFLERRALQILRRRGGLVADRSVRRRRPGLVGGGGCGGGGGGVEVPRHRTASGTEPRRARARRLHKHRLNGFGGRTLSCASISFRWRLACVSVSYISSRARTNSSLSRESGWSTSAAANDILYQKPSEPARTTRCAAFGQIVPSIRARAEGNRIAAGCAWQRRRGAETYRLFRSWGRN